MEELDVFSIQCDQQAGTLTHFWRGTGFAQPRLLLGGDMCQALQYVGSIPHQGITFVRVHYLLSLVSLTVNDTGTFVYDWSRLDQGIDLLIENNLKPFFELMGNPSNLFADFTDSRQIKGWRQLVRDLALHFIDRYGHDEVASWYFECWNEPDVKSFWNYSLEALFNYYDACSSGLSDASEHLRLGGPGTAHFLSETFRRFLDHCHNGRNYFTGEVGTRLDFISFHEKCAWACEVDLTPDVPALIARSKTIIEHIRRDFPRFADLPLMNNECDPQVGFNQSHTWRARPYYAAIVCKIIHQHIVEIQDRLAANFAFLANDNGFLGWWGHRTLLTRFTETDISPGDQDSALERFELIKKPVFNVMALLSLLGDTRCAAEVKASASGDTGIIATCRNDDQIALLMYHHIDRIAASGCKSITLNLSGIPFEHGVLVHYRIDEQHSNPFFVWEQLDIPGIPWHKGPRHPSAEQYALLREHQELAMLHEPKPVSIPQGAFSLTFDMPLPSVSLILLCKDPQCPPENVKNLKAYHYSGLHGEDEVLLTWASSASRMIRSYDVYYSSHADGPYRQINPCDLLCTAFLHVREKGHDPGFYRVRARDYWDRTGEYSGALEAEVVLPEKE